MALPQKSKNSDFFTSAEYLTWPDAERWEIIAGQAFPMTPAPGLLHQQISIALGSKLFAFFEDQICSVFAAPFDVRLPEADETAHNATNVVQPNIVVYCDPQKLDEGGGKRFARQHKLKSAIFPKLSIDLKKIFKPVKAG